MPVGRSVSLLVQRSTRVLPPTNERSSGGRFVRSLAAAQFRRRSLANYEYSLSERYAVIGCKLQVVILC